MTAQPTHAREYSRDLGMSDEDLKYVEDNIGNIKDFCIAAHHKGNNNRLNEGYANSLHIPFYQKTCSEAFSKSTSGST